MNSLFIYKRLIQPTKTYTNKYLNVFFANSQYKNYTRYFSTSNNNTTDTDIDTSINTTSTSKENTNDKKNNISFTLIDYSLNSHTIHAKEDDSFFDTVSSHHITIHTECWKIMQCSKCHCILEPNIVDNNHYIQPNINEEDQLDKLQPYTIYSRYSCQIIISKAFNNQTVYLVNDKSVEETKDIIYSNE